VGECEVDVVGLGDELDKADNVADTEKDGVTVPDFDGMATEKEASAVTEVFPELDCVRTPVSVGVEGAVAVEVMVEPIVAGSSFERDELAVADSDGD
jgi:hypothetical protein